MRATAPMRARNSPRVDIGALSQTRARTPHPGGRGSHRRYAGSVVKAMASAKHGYQKVAELFGPDAELAAASVGTLETIRSGRARSRSA
jgi:hypothetical protein